MSANNYIKIVKQLDDTFEVSERDMDEGGLVGSGVLGRFPTLEEAIHAANRYQNAEEVEYGLDIQLF